MIVPVAAIVTAYRRVDTVLKTLQVLHDCEPRPAEILVHVDDGQVGCAEAVARAFPGVRVILSDANVGPGGGRNRLVDAAGSEFIASFDDDSYPVDTDYFARVADLFQHQQAAWVLAANIFHLDDAITPASPAARWTADFTGCACAYRRAQYLEVGGYVPLPTAYGMEEVDFSLRLHALGGRILQSDVLRVRHETDLSHHADPVITAASIANVALLAFLRYPPSLWAAGIAQCANRIQWLVRHGRRRGVLKGIAAIPGTLARHRKHRRPLPSQTVRTYWALRRRALPA